MRKTLIVLLVLAFAGSVLLFGSRSATAPADQTELEQSEIKQDQTNKVLAYLQSKQSPLSHDEVGLLVEQKHWRLLIAVSAIESQYCKRQLGYNCWGIGGDSAYRHYKNFSEAIIDANALIEKWQQRGKWLTPEQMNCSYVVPCNENWVRTVNKVLQEIESF